MKHILSICILFHVVVAFGQAKGNTYMDADRNIISKDSFNILKANKTYISLKYDRDTTYLNVLFHRKTEAKLDSESFSKLKNYLTKISNRSFDNDEYILINYLS